MGSTAQLPLTSANRLLLLNVRSATAETDAGPQNGTLAQGDQSTTLWQFGCFGPLYQQRRHDHVQKTGNHRSYTTLPKPASVIAC